METNVVALPAAATLLDACDFFILHRLLALPIVDEEARMLVTATLLGILVPTLLGVVQRDPKVASGPNTLALTDLATLSFYPGAAT